MKTVQSLDELHRLALDRGAQVVRDGGTFNAAQQRIPQAPRPKPVAVVDSATAPKVEPPPAPAPQSPTVADIQQMLGARDQVWMRQLETVIGAFKSALAAASPGTVPDEWFFKVTYLPDGEIETVHAKAGPIAG